MNEGIKGKLGVGKEQPTMFFDYPAEARFRPERSIREKIHTTHKPLTDEEIAFRKANEVVFSSEDDKISYKSH